MSGNVGPQSSSLYDWIELPPLPPSQAEQTQVGLGGPFVGVHNDVLIVAGGANFPEAPPWKSGKKIWYDDVYILQKAGDGSYRWLSGVEAKLPKPMAYGVAITTEDGLICIGGINDSEIFADVFRLQWRPETRRVEIARMAPLPRPGAYMAGALVDNTIFVAGGQESFENVASTTNFFALDLSEPQPTWQELPPWPGPPRVVATAVGQSDGTHNNFYLLSGRLVKSALELEALADAYSYNPPSRTWRRLAEITVAANEPRSFVGAPGIASGSAHVLVFGGADGVITDRVVGIDQRIADLRERTRLSANPKERQRLLVEIAGMDKSKQDILNNHPGFSKDILAYHTITDTWTKVDELPAPSQITTSAVLWDNTIIFPSGEIQPGVRSNKVLRADPKRARSLGWLNSSVIGVYFIALVAMGVYFSRKEKTTDDFFRAGRRIPWWAAGLSIFGTSLSAITFMAVPAKSFATDWSYFANSMAQLAIAPVAIFLFLPFFCQLNVTTAYEYLERRFNLAARLLGSLAFLLFQFGRIGIVLFLPAIALSVVTGIDVYVCIIVVAVLSIVYTVLGGIEAVIWTDVLQVVVLLGGALISLAIILFNTDGGFAGFLEIARADHKLHTFDFSLDLLAPTFWVVFGGGLAANLIAQTSDQTLVQRYLTTRDEKSAAKGIWTHGLLAIPAALLFFGLGTALYVFFKSQPQLLSPTLDNADAIFPWFIISQLPAGLSGLLIAGIFAASMSSLDSSMNSAATVVTTDFYRRFRSNREDRHYLNLARAVTVVVGGAGMLFAILLAASDVKSLWDEFFKMIGLFAGGLAGLFLLGVLSKRAHALGALVGFFASALVQFWVSQTQAVHLLLFSLTGVVSCVVIGYVASVLIPKSPKAVEGFAVPSRRGVRN